MKRLTTFFLAVLMLISACLPAWALEENESELDREENEMQYVTSGDYVYTENGDGTITLVRYNGGTALRCVEVPDALDGKPVTALAEGLYAGCTQAVSAILPAALDAIGDGAFAAALETVYLEAAPGRWDAVDRGDLACRQLVAVEAGMRTDGTWVYGVTAAGSAVLCGPAAAAQITGAVVLPEAFEGCPVTAVVTLAYCAGMTSLTLPAGLEWSADAGFSGSVLKGCTGLQAIYAAEGGGPLLSLDGVLYARQGDALTLVAYPAGRADARYGLAYGTTAVGRYAFAYGASPVQPVLPASVTTIASSAFRADDAASAGAVTGVDTVWYEGDAAQWAQVAVDGSNAPAALTVNYLRKGDLDETGTVNVADALWLANIVAQKCSPNPVQQFNGDLNRDGACGLDDLILLMRQVVCSG